MLGDLPGLARVSVIDLSLHLVLLDAVALLDPALQLLALAADGRQVVVGELAPLLLHFAFHRLPVPLDAVPVHSESLHGRDPRGPTKRNRSRPANVPGGTISGCRKRMSKRYLLRTPPVVDSASGLLRFRWR